MAAKLQKQPGFQALSSFPVAEGRGTEEETTLKKTNYLITWNFRDKLISRLKKSRNLSDAKIKWHKNNMKRKWSDSFSMSIIKTATLLPSHTFITIILSYSVVMFWSSSSLLFPVSTPGSTSFVQSSNCPFIWTWLIKFDQIQGHIK